VYNKVCNAHTPLRLLAPMWRFCCIVLISRYLPVYISLIFQLTITNMSHKHYVPSNINNIILLLYLRPKKKSILAKLQRSSHDVISIESKVSSLKKFNSYIMYSVRSRFCNLEGFHCIINQKFANVLYVPETNIISLRNCCWFLKIPIDCCCLWGGGTGI
jgi:hypothetical protein